MMEQFVIDTFWFAATIAAGMFWIAFIVVIFAIVISVGGKLFSR